MRRHWTTARGAWAARERYVPQLAPASRAHRRGPTRSTARILPCVGSIACGPSAARARRVLAVLVLSASTRAQVELAQLARADTYTIGVLVRLAASDAVLGAQDASALQMALDTLIQNATSTCGRRASRVRRARDGARWPNGARTGPTRTGCPRATSRWYAAACCMVHGDARACEGPGVWQHHGRRRCGGERGVAHRVRRAWWSGCTLMH